MTEPDEKLLDGSKLSLLGLLHRVRIPQFFAAVGFFLAVGFAAGKLHASFIEKKESEGLANLLSKKEQRIAELETASTQCGRTLQSAQAELSDLRKTEAPSESKLKPDTAACEGQFAAERRTNAENVSRLERAAADAQRRVADPARLQTYFVKAQPGNTNVPVCISKATEAASRMGTTSNRLADEIHFNLAADAGLHYCFVGCYADVVVIACNGPSRFSSRGIVGQLQSYILGS